MATDLFEFWSGVSADQTIHPEDRDVLARARHSFELRALPGCYLGPLKTARIVLLYLSPGLSDQDVALAEAADPSQRLAHYARRGGLAPLPGPDEHLSVWNWWRNRTRWLNRPWQELRDEVAVLNIGAYHSKDFRDWPLLAALPSSRVALGWAQETLFREAEDGQRLVVCLRAARYWGLEEGRRYGAGLFAPLVTRSGHMKKREGSLRDEAIASATRFLPPESVSVRTFPNR